MFTKLKSLFKKKPEVKDEKPKKSRTSKPKEPELSPKELATKNNEPYVNILGMELDPENIGSGAIELDWNDKFILNLIRAGYKMKDTDTDQDIIDRWFQTVCRNIALEVYEQEQADPDNRMRNESFIRQYGHKDLGNGRSEIS